MAAAWISNCVPFKFHYANIEPGLSISANVFWNQFESFRCFFNDGLWILGRADWVGAHCEYLLPGLWGCMLYGNLAGIMLRSLSKASRYKTLDVKSGGCWCSDSETPQLRPPYVPPPISGFACVPDTLCRAFERHVRQMYCILVNGFALIVGHRALITLK